VKHFSLFLWSLAVCFGVSASAQDPAKTTKPSQKLRIVLVGDSTVTDDAGWGKGFKKFLNDDVLCINASRDGESSKSYRDKGFWAPVLKFQADYVLLQFGHNDQPGKGPAREAPAKTDYRANMKRYVEEAGAAGMRPVLVTSLVRRRYDEQGRIRSDLTEYAEVVKQVAKETNTPLVDLHALSIELFDNLGQDKCRTIEPKPGDTTHLNVEGSELVGQLVAEELGKVVPAIANRLRSNAAESHVGGKSLAADKPLTPPTDGFQANAHDADGANFSRTKVGHYYWTKRAMPRRKWVNGICTRSKRLTATCARGSTAICASTLMTRRVDATAYSPCNCMPASRWSCDSGI
jgi:lysophospholipase L1-like esterase